jgi:hypothetical protein
MRPFHLPRIHIAPFCLSVLIPLSDSWELTSRPGLHINYSISGHFLIPQMEPVYFAHLSFSGECDVTYDCVYTASGEAMPHQRHSRWSLFGPKSGRSPGRSTIDSLSHSESPRSDSESRGGGSGSVDTNGAGSGQTVVPRFECVSTGSAASLSREL